MWTLNERQTKAIFPSKNTIEEEWKHKERRVFHPCHLIDYGKMKNHITKRSKEMNRRNIETEKKKITETSSQWQEKTVKVETKHTLKVFRLLCFFFFVFSSFFCVIVTNPDVMFVHWINSHYDCSIIIIIMVFVRMFYNQHINDWYRYKWEHSKRLFIIIFALIFFFFYQLYMFNLIHYKKEKGKQKLVICKQYSLFRKPRKPWNDKWH